ncbi:hypothetical protein SGLAU_00160 [Streptomyces glaucescens]|uniref:Uncharacterized protein n=1 Tax=Streptomyces glaucescens TaxID=1907 RepID=A0A089WXB2_STRGA|nr:hypothetical protein SGLAU_00160 [Streptomyces glaucescens]
MGTPDAAEVARRRLLVDASLIDARFLNARGVLRQVPWLQVAECELAECVPVRPFPVRPGRRIAPGWWWSATDERLVHYGFGAMRTQVMLLDFERSVTALACSPVELVWQGRGRAPSGPRAAPVGSLVRRQRGPGGLRGPGRGQPAPCWTSAGDGGCGRSGGLALPHRGPAGAGAGGQCAVAGGLQAPASCGRGRQRRGGGVLRAAAAAGRGRAGGGRSAGGVACGVSRTQLLSADLETACPNCRYLMWVRYSEVVAQTALDQPAHSA